MDSLMPPRRAAADGVGGGLERMTAVELAGMRASGVDAHARAGVDGPGRRRAAHPGGSGAGVATIRQQRGILRCGGCARQSDGSARGERRRGLPCPSYSPSTRARPARARSSSISTGKVRAVAQQEFRQIFPQPGWVEHDAVEIWATQSGVLHEALAKAGIGARDIAAIGITNQRETTVLWDRATGRPVAHAIVWQDRRTAPLCDALRAAGHAAMIGRKTGLVLDAYFSGTKLKWLLDNVAGARERAARGELAFGTIDTWLVWNLTRGEAHVTDPSNASRTLLFDIHRGDWDDELLALFDIPRSVLPTRRSVVGRLCARRDRRGPTCRSPASRATSRRRSSDRRATRRDSRRTRTAPAASC